MGDFHEGNLIPLKGWRTGTYANSTKSRRQLFEAPFPDKFESCKLKILGRILPGRPSVLLRGNRGYSYAFHTANIYVRCRKPFISIFERATK